MPKISIIIPVYNAAKYLHQTLESVLQQSLKEIEVICVDDGSTDNSADIVREFAQKDNRIRLIQQRNQHAGLARNNGLEAASGEYIHFLDSDDYVLNYAYEAIYNKVVKYDLDCLKFASIAYDTMSGNTVELPSFTLNRLHPGDFNRLLDLEEGSPIYRVNISPWNGLYRRSFLMEKAIRFNDLYCVEDRAFFVQVITRAERMMIARDRLVVHRVNLTDSLVGVRAAYFDCHFRSIEQVSQQLQRDEIAPETAVLLMKKEFADMLAWYRRFYDDEQFGAQIQRETQTFVETYRGLGYQELQKNYRSLQRKLLRDEVLKDPEPEVIQVWWEECSKPKVSVVIPIFNVEDYLNEALYSLSVQSLHEMEFICVNDGSTDGCMAIIREYAEVDKRFRIIDKPNSGYGHSMNTGIDAARGQYLGILEPDDFVLPSMFRALYRVASKNKLDLVKANFYRFRVNEDGSLKKRIFHICNDKSYYDHLVNPSEDITTFGFEMNTWSGIYSMEFLNRYHIRHNETPGASYQDNGFWFQTFCRAQRAWFMDRPFYMYRWDNPNSSMANRQKVYCVTEEYRYIWNWMNTEPELVEKFSDIYYKRKYSNFIVTYRRIAEPLRIEYLHHICDEFRKPMEEGKINEELFGPFFWKQLNEILADPEAYYEKIRVSVIIPVYNAHDYIRQCLDSLLMQNNQRIEVICVDDGSTDDSLEILREYEKAYSAVKVLTQENAGAGAARNKGLAIARGEYLSFLDADDFFEPDMLYRAYQKAVADESDIVVFRCDQYLEDRKVYAGARYTINEELLPLVQPFAGADVPQDIFKLFVGWAWDKLFRADFVRENHLQFQEQRTSNDMLFVFSAVVKAQRISTMNPVMAHHRRDSGTLSVTREKSWECFYHALCALRQQLKDWDMYDRLEQDFINYAAHFVLWNITSLRGDAFFKLHDILCREWAADLGITAHDADYFYNPEEYEKIQELLAVSAQDFLFDQLDESNTRQFDMNNTINALRNKVRDLEDNIERINEDKNILKQEKAVLKKERNQLRKRYDEVKNSFVWKTAARLHGYLKK